MNGGLHARVEVPRTLHQACAVLHKMGSERQPGKPTSWCFLCTRARHAAAVVAILRSGAQVAAEQQDHVDYSRDYSENIGITNRGAWGAAA